MDAVALLAGLAFGLVGIGLSWQVWQGRRLDARLRDAHNRHERMLLALQERVDRHGQEAAAGVRELDRSLRAAQTDTREALLSRLHQHREGQQAEMHALKEQLLERFQGLQGEVQQRLSQHRETFDARQMEALKTLQDSLQTGMAGVSRQVTDALSRHAEELGRRVEGLTQSTDQRLKEISGQVEKRLTEGFEKTTATFADVVKRLALIDEAQKKITELSSNVVSLQEVLADKRSRGAFGEVQLAGLVRNVLPESAFRLQHTLGNGTRVDCLLFLPDPTGHVAVDAKFPLESYRRMTDVTLSDSDRLAAERQFKQDLRKHIRDIAEKYILPGETSDGAVMFIPAEAVFAEVHGHHPDLVEEAHQARVWLASPTTMMAILTTARAVLKDEATRHQVHLIQDHLVALSKDFDRFRQRMDRLSKHIEQASNDVKDVHTSARKITRHFDRIERVELEDGAPSLTVLDEGDD